MVLICARARLTQYFDATRTDTGYAQYDLAGEAGPVRDTPILSTVGVGVVDSIVGTKATSYSDDCLDAAESPLTDAEFSGWLRRSNECVDSQLRRGVMDMFPCCISALRAEACAEASAEASAEESAEEYDRIANLAHECARLSRAEQFDDFFLCIKVLVLEWRRSAPPLVYSL